MLRSYLCAYRDAYNVVKGKIGVGTNNISARNKKLIFKNNAPFRSCISKINNTFIGNEKDLDIFMPMYNLLHLPKWKMFYDIRKFVELSWR